MLDTQGWLHVKGALSPTELAEARAAADEYVAAAAAAKAGGPPLPENYSGNGEADGKGSHGWYCTSDAAQYIRTEITIEMYEAASE